MHLIGTSGSLALFSSGDSAVVVDTDVNLVIETGNTGSLSLSYDWSSSPLEISNAVEDLAAGALANFEIKIIASGSRMYTIPKGVQNEAKKALEWRKEHKRGGTPVGLNTARTLAKGGQIGIEKVRHIAKYFPRHEIDKKAKGFEPGEKGFPSRGRIAWALWGGDSAWRWSQAIVERENKKALTSDGYALPGYAQDYDDYGAPRMYDADTNAFKQAHELDPSVGPEFLCRVRLDGSGIDRLYKIDLDGLVYFWDGDGWDDLGSVDGDVYAYDKMLDDAYDTVPKDHVLIDPGSAIVISAKLQEAPFNRISIEEVDRDEAMLVANAISDVDWDFVDYSMTAAGEAPLDSTPGVDTPEEKSVRARRQVRDATGKFAAQGARVVINGDIQNGVGKITSINPDNGTVNVQLDSGSSTTVPANTTSKVENYIPLLSGPSLEMPEFDTSGILGQPRTPIDRPNAQIPGTLPALTSNDLQGILYNWPAWVKGQRDAFKPLADTKPVAVGTPSATSPAPVKDKAVTEAERQKLIGDTGRDIEKRTGNKIVLDPYDHPMLKDWLNKSVKKGGKTYYPNQTSIMQTITAAAKDNEELTPENSDVQPLYVAIVSPDDPRAVLDLVSVVPASSESNLPMAYKRVEGVWVRDEGILADLNSATPPPVVPLDADTLDSVLNQVDGTEPLTSSAQPMLDLVLMVLWGPKIESGPAMTDVVVDQFMAGDVEEEPTDAYDEEDLFDFSIIAAGGLDRNRGNAEKLRRYWTIGKGGMKIRWGTGGDWTRCYRYLKKYMGPRAKGYCALRHKEMNGVWPGDRNNRKFAMRQGGREVFTNEILASTEEILERASLNARRNDAKARLTMTAGGENYTGAKFVIPLVIPEGVESGDGRKFETDAIDIRELPLPLMWQIKTGEGHNGSVVVGRIDSMERIEGGIGNATGCFDKGAYGQEAERMVREGFLRGVSADMDKFEAQEVTTEAETDEDRKVESGKLNITKARVMGVTIVPKPAFQECKILIVDEEDNNQVQEETVIPDGVYMEDLDPVEAAALVACGFVAGAIPVSPPKSWFENPGLSKATPLTVSDEGRVYGHIAAWHVDHIGMAFGTRPPRSKSKYAYFHTGVVRADDGTDVPVGQLTLAGGHASLEASAVEAARHYDDTASAIADVHAGEDAYGIWVAGSLRPGASPEQIRALRASAPSGDWRPIKGGLELVAVCQVNVPGFPIARARVASGQVMALVAAGANTLARMKSDPVNELAARVDKLEQLEKQELSTKMAELSSRFAPIREERRAQLQTQIDDIEARVFAELIEEDGFGYIPMRERRKLAKEGKALPDGSFPITNIDSLKDSISAYGRGKPSKRAAIRRHIMKRARQLRQPDLIPEKWKQMADEEFSTQITTMRDRIAQLAVTASTPAPQEPTDEAGMECGMCKEYGCICPGCVGQPCQCAGGCTCGKCHTNMAYSNEETDDLGKAPAAEPQTMPGDDVKYISGKTQPRDAKGKFRQVLARIRKNAGDSGLQNVLEKIEETENLDDAGNYIEAARSATDLIGIIDRIDSGALNPRALENVRSSARELGETIANLPLPFGADAEKVRFSDLPPALRDLVEDMITRVEAKIGKEDADEATKSLRSYMSGGDVYSQGEISSELAKMLRLLT
jgi:hypothetical protein